MPPWTPCPTIPIDLKSGPNTLPNAAISQGRRLLDAVLSEFPGETHQLADLVRLRTANRFHKEAVRYARLVERTWRDIILANIAYDLAISMFGCSTMALATTNGPALARNMDWWPEDLLARATYLLDYRNNNSPALVTAGWPGSIGAVSGMSHRGFAATINAVAAPEGLAMTGYPVLLHLRRVLQDAANFDAALDQLSHTKLTTGVLFMLVGTENHHRVVIERTPTRHALRWAEDDFPLLVTNDYRILDQTTGDTKSMLAQTACARYTALEALARSLSPKEAASDTPLLDCLTDDRVQMGITAQHMIFRPASGHARAFVPTRLLGER
ncbi:C45 family autoproteolytic acyltransferase/hydrolase [Phycisphaeraceae bacterium D3-23]